jgi:diguanylate cyclase (GGDEF)-like protein
LSVSGTLPLVRHVSAFSAKIRRTDIHASWGGEEFVILAPDTSRVEAAQLAENLRVAIADAVFEDVGNVTRSFGIAQFEAGDTAEALLARADRMLYRAKLSGRNRVEDATMAPASGPSRLA